MSVTSDFRALVERIVDDLLAADPAAATALGDHRFDALLVDAGDEAARIGAIDDHVTALDAVDDVGLDIADRVDLEILRARLLRDRFELAELRTRHWNPMWWNPGTALYLLVSRPTGSDDDTRAAVRGRLASVPDFLAAAPRLLGDMPRIHAETAIGQLRGTRTLIAGDAALAAQDDELVAAAVDAVDRYSAWLEDRLPECDRNPRLGAALYPAALWHALDDDTPVDDLLAAARGHLDEVGERMRALAAQYLGLREADDSDVHTALARIADSAPVTDATVLPLMVEAIDRTSSFVRERELVSVPELDIRVIDMPDIHRGVAVAYCDAPGPLEEAVLPTFVAVAPTPDGWDAGRVASFYREYNAVQLHDLAIHEAMPGHVLQLAHARALQSATRVRRFGRSGVFIEGWAVYAEEAMVRAGYRPVDDDASSIALALQQHKMLARGIINAILDIEVHARAMPEEEAMALMRQRGFQEEGEAIGKWRRALLTWTQLPTYYVGYRGVSAIASDLRVLHPDWSDREVHDLMLAHGSPAPRHLRSLLGI